ncbi:MAG: DUF6209 family protein [Gammaproteobacteria bacterium]
MVTKRIFASEPGQIRFTEDFHEQTRGCLLPGKPITLEFADVRIPDEPSGLAQIAACVQFDQGLAQSIPLQLRKAWRDIDPALTEAGEGNLWVGAITAPPHTRELVLWFEKVAPSGKRYYDSRFGKNYWFRFTSLDVSTPDAGVDARGFHVTVDAQSDVGSIVVPYQILNRGLVSGALELRAVDTGADSDRRTWSGSAPLDPNAVVSFDVAYTVSGRSYTDDNQRRHYTAPDPDTVLAERREAALKLSP